MKKIPLFGLVLVLGLAFAQSVLAHAVVTPNQANVGQFTNFSLGVPSEKPIATTGVRLVLPSGLNYVMPFVKPGWKVEVKKDKNEVTEITWTGGSIPAEQKDQFLFSAQVPANETSLAWKVYQTYSDGSVVSWDKDPSAPQPKDQTGKSDFSKVGPFSTTKIINDLKANTPPASQLPNNEPYGKWALVLSAVALIFSIFSLLKVKQKI